MQLLHEGLSTSRQVTLPQCISALPLFPTLAIIAHPLTRLNQTLRILVQTCAQMPACAHTHTQSLGFLSVLFVYMTVNYNIIMLLLILTIEYILVANLSVFFSPSSSHPLPGTSAPSCWLSPPSLWASSPLPINTFVLHILNKPAEVSWGLWFPPSAIFAEVASAEGQSSLSSHHGFWWRPSFELLGAPWVFPVFCAALGSVDQFALLETCYLS